MFKQNIIIMHNTKLLIFFTFRVRTRKNVVQNVLQHFTSNKAKEATINRAGFRVIVDF